MHHNECQRSVRSGAYVIVDGYVFIPIGCNDCSSKCKQYYNEVTVREAKHAEDCPHKDGDERTSLTACLKTINELDNIHFIQIHTPG